MNINTIILSFLTATAAQTVKAQTFNEVSYSPKATTFSLVT